MLACAEVPTYLFSIRPDAAEALLAGTKPHEFRKRFGARGQVLGFLYATRPVRAITGAVVFGDRIAGSANALLALLSRNRFDTEESLRRYLGPDQHGCALPVHRATALPRPVALEELRAMVRGFAPPVSHMRLECARYVHVRHYLMSKFREATDVREVG